MEVISSIKKMQKYSDSLRESGKIIGLVPTMGYLHEGHLSLIDNIRPHCDKIIVSVFVNPTQFGQGEDFDEYPRNIKRDKTLLSERGADVIFYPSAKEIYSKDFSTYVVTEKITEGLCGKYRPGHFKGVTTIVSKLFNITKPHKAIFGEKDYQQALVIKRMTRDLNFDIEILTSPTVREEDGLAMSSRNEYLSENQRNDAALIYKSLTKGKEMIEKGEKDCSKIRAEINKILSQGKSLNIQYLFIGDSESLEEWDTVKGKTLIATAVFAGKTRLIDNIIAKPK